MNEFQKTESEQIDFFERCYERFLKAKAAVGEINHFYRIGETSVRLVFAGDKLISHLTPALEHIRIPGTDSPDLTLCIWDSTSTSTEMLPPPCILENFTERGDIWGFNSTRIKTAFLWGECSVNLMDYATNKGIYWVARPDTLPYWVHASPLRTLFHWWMEKNGCRLLHAAAVGTDEGAVLLTGKGGVGKSTSALSCLQAGLFYLGDDFLITVMEPEPLVYSLYSTAKLSADHVVNFPDLSGLIQNAKKLDQEKAVMFLYPHFEKQIVKRMPLKGIFMPRIADQHDTRLTSGSLLAIQRAISFTTMSLLPYAGRHTHDFICRLSSILPGYTLELGKDLKKIPFAVSGFLGDLPNHKPYNGANFPGSVHATIESETKPLVSVIIPVFNGEQFIKDAVDNILSQDYPALELIIVNDGSTDRTEEIIKGLAYDIRYFKQANEGPASARNRGIKNASGELIMFLDVDDLWPENNLHVLVNEMISEPDIDVIQGCAQLMKYNFEINDYEYIGNTKDSFPYSIAAAIYRKSVFTKVGLFDRLMFGEDMDWFYRAIELKVKIKRLDDVTLIVRKHGKNMTRGKSVIELNMLRVVKKHLDRVRVEEARSRGAKSINEN